METGNESRPVLSVIAVTWNAKKYVDECLRSLAEKVDVPVEVIIVDNASSDGTPELISQKFPQFRLIRNSDNLGFARANNIGIDQARGKYLCLVNSDVVLPHGCLDRLYEYMEAHPDIGIVGPQMIGPAGQICRSTMRFPSLSNSLGRAFALDRVPFISWLIGGQIMADFNHDETCDVDVLNGWFWLVRREALEQVGLLDELFFIYGEDMDWCYRFHKAKWRVVFYAGASALHYGGASSSAAPVRFYLEMQKANLQYWQKHHGLIGQAVNYLFVFLLHCIRAAVYFLIHALRPRGEGYAAKMQRSWAMLSWMCSSLKGSTRPTTTS